MSWEILSPCLRSGRDEKRDAILGIAYNAFLTEGFAATSMSSIAAKVGGSKATLYNYFASKEELFAAVIAEKCRDFHHALFDAEPPAGDIRTALSRLGERLLHLMMSEEKIAVYRLITAETARFPELGRAFYESGPEKGICLLAVYFDRAIAEGQLKNADARTMAGHFFALCRGDLHNRRVWNVTTDVSEAEIRESAREAVDVFLAAFGT